ncbi:hypothetical protein EAE96_000933 [Botrytis aclada]|nr:hypothetical protein EAE96_000933 [Botrytis aclada]
MVVKAPTVHHCPQKSKGNCRRAYTPGPNSRLYCSAHMTYCKEDGCRLQYLLGNQLCERCAAMAEKEELQAKETAEKEARDKENAGSNKNGKDKEKKHKPKSVNKKIKVCQFILLSYILEIPRNIYMIISFYPVSSSHCAT